MAGLRGKNGEVIPLRGVVASCRITDQVAEVTLQQRFHNAEDKAIEAVYTFPIDEQASVCSFRVKIDDRTIIGEVKAKEEAQETYDDAIAAGHGGYLLEQDRPDIFTCQVGNLPPGKEAVVSIAYVTSLRTEGEAARFVLPTTVSPRYTTRDTPAEEVERLAPPTQDAQSIPYGLNVDIAVTMPSNVKAIESPTHPIKVEVDGRMARVTLGTATTALDQDFVVMIHQKEPREQRVWAEEWEEPIAKGELPAKAAAMFVFYPLLQSSENMETPSEMIFVVDRSGSMGGQQITQAKAAMQLFLRSLPETCTFNIIGFGSNFQKLFPKSMPYNDQTLEKASKHVDQIRADLGGTEILQPLKAIFAEKPNPEFPRQLFVLTDGEVGNTDEVLREIRKHPDTRVFTLGIGSSVSHELVNGMARAGRGVAEFVGNNERMEAKVIRTLQRAMQPSLTSIKIDWGPLKVVHQTPKQLSSLFSGDRLIVCALLAELKEATVQLTAHTSRDKQESFCAKVDPSRIVKGRMIHRYAARGVVRDFEDEGASMAKKQVVQLGLAYQIMTQYTSFVAVEERMEPGQDAPVLRKVPVAVKKGWEAERRSLSRGALFGASGGRGRGGMMKKSRARKAPMAMDAAPPNLMAMMPAMPSAPSRAMHFDSMFTAEKACMLGDDFDSLAEPLAAKMEKKQEEECKKKPSPQEPSDNVKQLIRQQRADGSWDLDQKLTRLIGVDMSACQAIVQAEGAPEKTRLLATALALRFLELRASGLREEWALLAAKAQRYMDEQTRTTRQLRLAWESSYSDEVKDAFMAFKKWETENRHRREGKKRRRRKTPPSCVIT